MIDERPFVGGKYWASCSCRSLAMRASFAPALWQRRASLTARAPSWPEKRSRCVWTVSGGGAPPPPPCSGERPQADGGRVPAAGVVEGAAEPPRAQGEAGFGGGSVASPAPL